MPDLNAEQLAAWIKADLAEIEKTHMPFGKFGPAHFPPLGVPLFDLPLEYLGWFARKNVFPKGRLGELLRIVHQMKADGADSAFNEMRARRGGRAILRQARRGDERRF